MSDIIRLRDFYLSKKFFEKDFEEIISPY